MSVSKLVLLLTSGIVMVNSFPNVENGVEDNGNTGIFVVKEDNDNVTLTAEQDLEECAEDEWSCHQKGIEVSNCRGYSCVKHMTRCVLLQPQSQIYYHKILPHFIHLTIWIMKVSLKLNYPFFHELKEFKRI